MMRSLWTAATGMVAQQFNIDTISNNLSNVNTAGFKKTRAEFEELLYQKLKLAGTPSTINTNSPTGIEVGLGVKPSATLKVYSQGKPTQTGNLSDLLIMGEGFFKIRLQDGTEAYTRDGSFKIDSNGELVTSNGNYLVEPPITLPKDYVKDSLQISTDGIVSVKAGGSDDLIAVGEIRLYKFINPAGLTNIGGNIVKETSASGPAYEGIPGLEGFGELRQGFLEFSNVEIVEELVNMIVAQRAYEFNSKAIQTSDNMLGVAVNLKR